jgi:hypothetical protein
MSEMGHKQTLAVRNGKSALHSIADIQPSRGHVRFGSETDFGLHERDVRSGLVNGHERENDWARQATRLSSP